ncbi:MAG: DUF2828 family protein [Anaeroplasmataceae bacterium]
MTIEELQNKTYTINTKGGLYYDTTFNANLDAFTMASRFMPEEKLQKLFINAYNENKELLAAIILYNLDIRGGKGERRIFKVFFHLMCLCDQDLAKQILAFIPSLGRYDYIFEAYDTPVWQDAFLMIKERLKEDINSPHPSLLAKWMPSLRTHNKNNPFAKKLSAMLCYSEREYRHILSTLRTKLDIVEKRITNKDYTFNYENIPSKAMKNYNNLFMSRDRERFIDYLSLVSKGKASINTKGLAPYELVKSIIYSNNDPTVVDQLWNNLDNYFDGSHSNVLVVADTSGSMTCYDYLPISSALGLAIYAAQRNTGVFHNKFINFSDRPSFQQIKGETLSQMLKSIDYDNWECSTNIDAAMKMILQATKKSKEDCPSHLVIISDMEFDSCTNKKSNYQKWKEEYQKNGLEMPKIVFWNVAGNAKGIPVTKNEDGVALVSGFSPVVFKGLFDLENYKPINAMLDILKPYLEMLS